MSKAPAGGADLETPRPKVLIITAFRWLSTVRLALELSQAGFVVEMLCPAGEAIEKLPFVSGIYRYKALSQIAGRS